MKNSPIRAFGLLEVMIASALALLLLGLLHRLLVPVLRTGERTSIKTQLRQQATLALDSLVTDLLGSKPSTYSYLPRSSQNSEEPVVLAMTKSLSVSSASRPLYERRLTVFIWRPNEATLSRRTLSPRSPELSLDIQEAHPTILTSAQLLQLARAKRTEKVLARHVTEFDPLGHWPPENSAKISLTLEQERSGQNEPERLALEHYVSFRN